MQIPAVVVVVVVVGGSQPGGGVLVQYGEEPVRPVDGDDEMGSFLSSLISPMKVLLLQYNTLTRVLLMHSNM